MGVGRSVTGFGAAIVALLALAAPLQAEVVEKTATIKGVSVSYAVVLPSGYDPAKPYPAVLAFPPGGQDMGVVRTTLNRVWRAQAESRGYIVIEPAAPGGQMFFEGGDKIFPDFLTKLLADYKILDGKFHIAGMSNGGLSSFRIAAAYPRYFWSLTGFPGFLEDATPAQLGVFKTMCLAMFVGERDSGWRAAMEAQAKQFRAQGIQVAFAVEKGQDHVLDTLANAGAQRLFDQFETARAGHCAP